MNYDEQYVYVVQQMAAHITFHPQLPKAHFEPEVTSESQR